MPARFADLIRALRALDVEVEASGGGGSHYKARRNGKVYPIPAHNGDRSEIGDVYLKGVCRCFEIDPADLKKLL